MLLIASGEVGEDELREQSGWKFSEESSHRATSPRAARGRQFARPGSIIKHFICIENIFYVLQIGETCGLSTILTQNLQN